MTRTPTMSTPAVGTPAAGTPAVGRRRFLAGAAGAATLVGLGLPRASRARTPDTLVFGLSSYPPSLAPFQNAGTASGTVKVQMFRGLLNYDNRGEIRPEVAESFEQQSPTVLQFKLRANAKFHNGDPVTGEDVKYSFEHIVAERSTAFLKTDFAIVERVEVVDPRTVKVHLKQPSATFQYLLASWYAPIVSHKSTAQNTIPCAPYNTGDIDRPPLTP